MTSAEFTHKIRTDSVAELWIDATTIAHLGIPLDYHKLRSVVRDSIGKDFQYLQYLQGHYYSYDKPSEEWLQQEQQRAEEAGFALELSEPWTERVRCMYCSCLNAVNFPAPVLLKLQAELLRLFYANDLPSVYLFSNNAPLLNSLFELQIPKLHLIALGDSLDNLAVRTPILRLDPEQIEAD